LRDPAPTKGGTSIRQRRTPSTRSWCSVSLGSSARTRSARGCRRRPCAWLTRGYDERVEDVVGDALFEEDHRNMVMVRDIELYSLCEHHLLPFFGKAHVAYIPHGKILGLSKVPRIVDMFARRLQVQERLTSEIAEAIEESVHPLGVGVVIEASHLC